MLDCKSSVIGWLGVTGTQRLLCLLYSLILNMEYIICEYFFCISILAGILLRFPYQKHTVLVRKPYFLVRRTYVFGTETVEGRLLGRDSDRSRSAILLYFFHDPKEIAPPYQADIFLAITFVEQPAGKVNHFG